MSKHILIKRNNTKNEFAQMLDSKNISPTCFAKYSGYDRRYVYKWYKGIQIPKNLKKHVLTSIKVVYESFIEGKQLSIKTAPKSKIARNGSVAHPLDKSFKMARKEAINLIAYESQQLLPPVNLACILHNGFVLQSVNEKVKLGNFDKNKISEKMKEYQWEVVKSNY